MSIVGNTPLPRRLGRSPVESAAALPYCSVLQRPGQCYCHTIAIPLPYRQWYNCHTIAIQLLWQSPQQSLVYVLRHTPHGGNPHIPLLLDPENPISRRHGKTHGSGTIYVPNVCFTSPRGQVPLPPLLFFWGVPPPSWQQNALISRCHFCTAFWRLFIAKMVTK